jgi:hypothetical protein
LAKVIPYFLSRVTALPQGHERQLFDAEGRLPQLVENARGHIQVTVAPLR